MPAETTAVSETKYGIVEQALKKSEARFRLVVETAPSAMVMIRACGQIEMVNAQAERVFGYPREELLGQPMEMLVPHRFRTHNRALRGAFFGDPQSRPLDTGLDLFGLRKDGSEFPVEIGLIAIETEDGTMVLSAIVDISVRKRQEERFRLVVESAPSAMVMIRTGGQIEMVNAQAERIFGYKREELLGQSMEMLLPERFRSSHPALRGAFFDDPHSRAFGAGRDLFGLRKDGSEFPVEIGLNPIETEDGTMVLSAIVDISERVNAAQALACSEAEFRASFEGAAVGKVLADPESRRIVRANRAFARMLGYEPEELVDRSSSDFIWHEDLALDVSDYARLLSGEDDTHVAEKRYTRRDGSPFWVRISATLARAAGSSRPTIVVMAIEDIDTRYKAETALRRAVQERTNALDQRNLLLREVYHRVKNNLQIVDSLLKMQARKIEDPQAKQALLGLRGRVFALGLVHQQLMGSADLKTFDIAPFLNELSRNILDGLGTNGVNLTVEACPLDVGLDFAVPLGLLVTELVTNSLKHAFPEGRGNISVNLRNDPARRLVLVVSDDGIGLSATGTKRNSATGLGTRIIKSLVDQLDGTITPIYGRGTTTEVRLAMPVSL